MDKFCESKGHAVFIGPTMSGKSYLMRKIVKMLNPPKTYVFTNPNNESWTSFPNVSIYHDLKAIEVPIRESKTLPRHPNNDEGMPGDYIRTNVVVFDDFKEIKTITANSPLSKLLSTIRHSGIRMLIATHDPNEIGPSARQACRYQFLMAKAGTPEGIRRCASTFLGGNYRLMEKAFSDAKQKSEYAFIFNDRDNLEAMLTDVARSDPQVQVPIPPDSAMAQGQAAYVGMSPTNVINMNKTANNLLDQSTNNIQMIPNHTQLNNIQQAQFQNRMEQIKQSHQISRQERLYRTLELLRTQYYGYEDKLFILQTFNETLTRRVNGKPAIIPMEEFEKAKAAWLKKYFPEYEYLAYQKEDKIANTVLTSAKIYNNPDSLQRAMSTYLLVDHLAPGLTQRLPAAVSKTALPLLNLLE